MAQLMKVEVLGIDKRSGAVKLRIVDWSGSERGVFDVSVGGFVAMECGNFTIYETEESSVILSPEEEKAEQPSEVAQ